MKISETPFHKECECGHTGSSHQLIFLAEFSDSWELTNCENCSCKSFFMKPEPKMKNANQIRNKIQKILKSSIKDYDKIFDEMNKNILENDIDHELFIKHISTLTVISVCRKLLKFIVEDKNDEQI